MASFDDLFSLTATDAARAKSLASSLATDLRTGTLQPSATDARRGLDALRSDMFFAPLAEVGLAMQEALPERDFGIDRRVAQALVELDELDLATNLLAESREFAHGELDSLLKPKKPDDVRRALDIENELRELDSLLGRSYKQRYIDGLGKGLPFNLLIDSAFKALHHYGEAWRSAPVGSLWYGINYVAVSKHVARRSPADAPQDVDGIARELIESAEFLEQAGRANAWVFATRAEAHYALGEMDEAQTWLHKFLYHPDIDRFAIGSITRQFTQVWEAASSLSGQSMLDMLRQRDDELLAAVHPGATEELQARHEDPDYISRAYGNGGQRARGVARVQSGYHVGLGTGFLFPGRVLGEGWRDHTLLMTCAHVCSEPPYKGHGIEAVRPKDALFLFLEPPERSLSTVIVERSRQIWKSPVSQLDVTILALGGMPTGVPEYPVRDSEIATADKANIVSHPLGGAKFFSVEENGVKKVNKTRFDYSTATDPGSSGGPVFDDKWRLIGVHRQGVKPEKVNRGTRIDRILETARNELKS